MQKAFPTPEALTSPEARSSIAAWADHQLLSTKTVEFMHRSNSSVSRSRGPAKPSSFLTVASAFVTQRLQTLHTTALGLTPQRSSFKLKKHPQIGKVTSKIRALSRKSPRQGVVSNPHFWYLNAERQRLAAEGLPRAEFKDRISEAAAQYDAGPAIREAAKNQWRLARLSGDSVGPPPGNIEGVGPWGLGDSFWPLSEQKLRNWMRDLPESKEGGVRPIADVFRQWQVATHSLCSQMFDHHPQAHPPPTSMLLYSSVDGDRSVSMSPESLSQGVAIAHACVRVRACLLARSTFACDGF